MKIFICFGAIFLATLSFLACQNSQVLAPLPSAGDVQAAQTPCVDGAVNPGGSGDDSSDDDDDDDDDDDSYNGGNSLNKYPCLSVSSSLVDVSSSSTIEALSSDAALSSGLSLSSNGNLSSSSPQSSGAILSSATSSSVPPLSSSSIVSGGNLTGSLAVSVTTTTITGAFSPKNVVAIWVENAAGQYISTLDAHGFERIHYLSLWTAKTGNTTDGVSGATRGGPGALTTTWNGKNKAGVLQPQGTYKVIIQMTSGNTSGKNATITISLGNTSVTQLVNATGFQNFKAVYTP
jgi:hypothetical protein